MPRQRRTVLTSAVLLLCCAITGRSFVLQQTKIPRCRDRQLAKGRLQVSSSTSAVATTATNSIPDNVPRFDAVIVGGGPAGLLSAIMLAQLQATATATASTTSTSTSRTYKRIMVYDRLSAPPQSDDPTAWSDTDDNVAKFYLLGMGGRGQAAMKHFGVWDDVLAKCVAVLGRRDWPPGTPTDQPVERIFTSTDKLVTTQVLPRDKLVGVFCEHIQQHYADRITVQYGYEVVPLDFEYNQAQTVLLQVTPCFTFTDNNIPSSMVKTATEEPFDVLCDIPDDEGELQRQWVQANLVIAADGTVRTFAKAMELADQQMLASMDPINKLLANNYRFRITKYKDDNQRVYKTVPLQIPLGGKDNWRHDLNYSVRTSRINFDALPANDRGNYCGVLLWAKDDPLAKANTNVEDLRALFQEQLPQFLPLLQADTLATVAAKPVSYLPGFRYAGPRLHQGPRTVILGDCAHTVKPYFGLGCNSALEDVQVLGRILADHGDGDIRDALQEFSNQRAPESATLVRLSRELDRPGVIGFITFILPIIMDAIFSGLAPQIFQPNVITMLQREQYTFQQVAERKRRDRILQVLCIVGVVSGTVWLGTALVQTIAQATDTSSITVMAGMGAGIASVVLLQQLLPESDVWEKISPLQKLQEKDRRDQSFLAPLGSSRKSSKKNNS